MQAEDRHFVGGRLEVGFFWWQGVEWHSGGDGPSDAASAIGSVGAVVSDDGAAIVFIEQAGNPVHAGLAREGFADGGGGGSTLGEGDPVAEGGGVKEIQSVAKGGGGVEGEAPAVDEIGGSFERAVLTGGVVFRDFAGGFWGFVSRQAGGGGFGVVDVPDLPSFCGRQDDDFADAASALGEPVGQFFGQ